MVELVARLLLKDPGFPTLPESEFRFTVGSDGRASERRRWADMVRTIFEDVLPERLHLTTSERLGLFLPWIWLLPLTEQCERHAAPGAKFVLKFILTLPREQQGQIFHGWAATLVRDPPNPAETYAHDFMAEVHSRWRKHLISRAVTPKPRWHLKGTAR